MVGRIALVILAGLLPAADPPTIPPASTATPLPGETAEEAEHWQAQAEAIRLQNRGDPLSWSTTVRTLGLGRKDPSWRASLGVDCPHPRVNRARQAEGAAEVRALGWERLAAARLHVHEEQDSRFAIAMANDRVHLLKEVLAAAIAAEQAIEMAITAGAATRDQALEARAGRLTASVEEAEAAAALQGAILRHQAHFGAEPGPAPVGDAGLMDLPDEELVRRALAADAGLAAASCRMEATAARTTRASVPAWSWPASLQAIADYDDGGRQQEWTFGLQATIRLSAPEDRLETVAAETVAAASRRMAADLLRRTVVMAAAEARSTRSLMTASRSAQESWSILLADADAAATVDPSLGRRRDDLRIREARARLVVLDRRQAHQQALLVLGRLLGSDPSPECAAP